MPDKFFFLFLHFFSFFFFCHSSNINECWNSSRNDIENTEDVSRLCHERERHNKSFISASKYWTWLGVWVINFSWSGIMWQEFMAFPSKFTPTNNLYCVSVNCHVTDIWNMTYDRLMCFSRCWIQNTPKHIKKQPNFFLYLGVKKKEFPRDCGKNFNPKVSFRLFQFI